MNFIILIPFLLTGCASVKYDLEIEKDLSEKYKKEVIPKLVEKYGYTYKQVGYDLFVVEK